MEKREISIILPAFNEAETISDMVVETSRAMERSGFDFELIVADDGSSDDTLERVAAMSAEFPHVRAVRSSYNQGKGNALKRGFYASDKELVCFLDADLDLHPDQILTLVDRMDETGADIVIGSKRHPDSVLNYPWYRKLYSTVYYYLVLLLFRLPVKDTQTGIKLFRRRVLADTFPRLVLKRFALDLELLVVAHRLGFKIADVPITLSFRRKFGRIAWRDVRSIIVDTMAVFYRLYFLRYYDGYFEAVTAEEPAVSIVVPAKEWDPMVEECIARCGELDYGNFDVLLVLDGEDQRASAAEYCSVLASGPVGPSVKRNMAARESSAEIIAFIDSDAWPEHDWLRNAVAYFGDEKVAAVCGPAVTPASDGRRQWASGLLYSSSMVSGSTVFRYTRHTTREVDDFPSCNLLVKRDDFEKTGGFPEEFWPGEDTVLCLRLTHDLGKKMFYVPSVIINHHRRPVYGPHLQQVFSYSRHRGYFVRRFPQTSRRVQFFIPSLFVLMLIAGLGMSFVARPILYAYLSIVGLYLALAIFSSIKSLDVLVNLMIFPGIIATNVVYGVGFMLGLLSRGMERS